jgi:hypothetical protein
MIHSAIKWGDFTKEKVSFLASLSPRSLQTEKAALIFIVPYQVAKNWTIECRYLIVSQFTPKISEDHDVDIESECCGVCGSDIHTITGGWGMLLTHPSVLAMRSLVRS